MKKEDILSLSILGSVIVSAIIGRRLFNKQKQLEDKFRLLESRCYAIDRVQDDDVYMMERLYIAHQNLSKENKQKAVKQYNQHRIDRYHTYIQEYIKEH